MSSTAPHRTRAWAPLNATRQIGGAVGLSVLTLLPTYGGTFLAGAVITLLIAVPSIGKAS
ncbi:hypothetical protein [Streptosporangium sp. NPDC000396]|uniref:hypothetical protein n=1 Tax=Streptosporangium sp. NPDC000396 TaxID=3366185 RepID=UPI0036C2350C